MPRMSMRRLKKRFRHTGTAPIAPTGGEEPLGVHECLRVVHTVKHLQRHPDTLGAVTSAAGGGARVFLENCWVWSIGWNETSLSLQDLSYYTRGVPIPP